MKDEDKKFTLIEIREKVMGWKKEGFLVDELENILFQNQNIKNNVQVPKKQKKSTGKIIVAIVVIFFLTLAVAATVYVYVSGTIGESPQLMPNVQFFRDNQNKWLIVSSVDPGNLQWSEFSIIGDCDISSLDTYVRAADTIHQCYGTITIRYDPTNTLIGAWTFTDSPQTTPNLQLVRDNVNRRLTVASADPGNLQWTDFEISGICDISSLGFTVKAGDVIAECSGTITIRHIPTNTLIGTWTFS